MSDHIPFEIQIEIIKRLPVKSLIQFRSVSKTWKSVIDSSEFIAAHTLCQIQQPQHHLLMRYTDPVDRNLKYVSIVDDDDICPQQKCVPTLPLSITQLKPKDGYDGLFHDTTFVGTSHGLLCFFSPIDDAEAVVWNPTIRKLVVVAIPNVYGCKWTDKYVTYVRFGVSSDTLDPKIVKITFSVFDDISLRASSWLVEVFNLSSWTWKSQVCNAPCELIGFDRCQVVIDGFIYWHAFDIDLNLRTGQHKYHTIISFDLNSEEIVEIYLPESLLQPRPYKFLSLCKLKESLALLEVNSEDWSRSVWIMEHNGVANSFTRLFTITTPDAVSIIKVLGFRNNGTPIFELRDVDKHGEMAALAVYDPDLEHISEVGVFGKWHSFYAHFFMETLLLLGHQ